MPFAATQTDLEIILSEVNRTRERQISYDITYMLNTIKMIKNIYRTGKKTHRFQNQSYNYRGEMGEGKNWKGGNTIYTLVYRRDDQ